jgi:hypothetical protein
LVIPDGTRADERRIKNQKNTARFVRAALRRIERGEAVLSWR